MNGRDVRVWIDRWYLFILSGWPTPRGEVRVSRNTKVNSLISLKNGEWEIEFLKPFTLDEDYGAMLKILIGDPELRDRLVWSFDKEGNFFCQIGIPLGYFKETNSWKH